MKKELINPFIEACATVMPQIISGIVFTRMGLMVSNDVAISPHKQVVIVLGVTGKLRGRVIYSFDESLATQIVEVMLCEQGIIIEKNVLARSAIAEMTNMITGKAIMLLVDLGYQTDFSPPALIIGRDIQIPEGDVPAILIPFQTQFGYLYINIALREAK